MKPGIILFIFFSLIGIDKLYSQFSFIDSARKKVYAAVTEKEKIASLIAINKYRNSLPSDSLYHFAQLIK